MKGRDAKATIEIKVNLRYLMFSLFMDSSLFNDSVTL